jgi:hypothetical protein
MKLNRDLLNTVPLRKAANACVAVVDAIQDFPKEVQAVAIAATFVLLAERFGLPAQDLMTVTSNVMNHAEGRRAEFQAVSRYLKTEV